MELSFLSTEEKEELKPHLQRSELKKGEALFRPGDTADGVFFVESGRLGVQTKTGFEDRQQVVALLGEGAPVGERAFAVEGERGMTVIAIEDSVIFFLSTTHFKDIEEGSPKLAIALLKKLLRTTVLRLQASSERLAHVL